MVVTVSILNERKKKNFTKLLLGYGTCWARWSSSYGT
jgi:hypothetical protein